MKTEEFRQTNGICRTDSEPGCEAEAAEPRTCPRSIARFSSWPRPKNLRSSEFLSEKKKKNWASTTVINGQWININHKRRIQVKFFMISLCCPSDVFPCQPTLPTLTPRNPSLDLKSWRFKIYGYTLRRMISRSEITHLHRSQNHPECPCQATEHLYSENDLISSLTSSQEALWVFWVFNTLDLRVTALTSRKTSELRYWPVTVDNAIHCLGEGELRPYQWDSCSSESHDWSHCHKGRV